MKSVVENYPELLQDLQSLLTKAKYQAYKAVDNLRVQTYWQIGERIVREELQHKDKAEYGDYLITHLAHDLGFSKVMLHYMVKFYTTYPIVQTVSEQLSWSHLVELIYIGNVAERQFYELQIIQNGWSVRALRQEMAKKLYQRAYRQGNVVVRKNLPLVQPEDIFKNSYTFDFLDLKKSHTEKELKDALVKQLERFLQELGHDFFIGRREVPLLVGGNYDKIDLELFHAGLLCYILVEVKTEPFQHKHVSQMYS